MRHENLGRLGWLAICLAGSSALTGCDKQANRSNVQLLIIGADGKVQANPFDMSGSEEFVQGEFQRALAEVVVDPGTVNDERVMGTVGVQLEPFKSGNKEVTWSIRERQFRFVVTQKDYRVDSRVGPNAKWEQDYPAPGSPVPAARNQKMIEYIREYLAKNLAKSARELLELKSELK